MKIYIIRHGVTEWNAQKRVQGSVDIPLAEAGIRLAEKTGTHLKNVSFDVCYTSPMVRARKTAELILGDRAGKVPVIEDRRLMEIDFGVLEGVRYTDDEGNVISKEIDTFFKDPFALERPLNGENVMDVCERTREFFQEIIHEPSLQDKTVLITSHGCTVRALLRNVYEDKQNFWHGSVPPNCSVNIIEVVNGHAQLVVEDKVFK